MSRTITLDDEAVIALEVLRKQAIARGISLDRYLEALAEKGDQVLKTFQSSPHDLSEEEFHQWLQEASAGLPPLPPIPADFSRADLYDDHD